MPPPREEEVGEEEEEKLPAKEQFVMVGEEFSLYMPPPKEAAEE